MMVWNLVQIRTKRKPTSFKGVFFFHEEWSFLSAVTYMKMSKYPAMFTIFRDVRHNLMCLPRLVLFPKDPFSQ